MKVALISSVYGGYDIPHPPVPQDVPCEMVLVTDRECPNWPGRVVIEPRSQLHPRLAAKVAKCRPDLYADADAYVWMDASFVVNSTDFVSWAVSHLENGAIAQIPHPDRKSVVDEAAVSAQMAKYLGLPVNEQARHYLRQGYPDGWGMWATGLIAYRHLSVVSAFGDAWLREQMRWTYQDQVSEAPVLHSMGLKPVDLDGPLLGHSKFAIRGHRDEL